MPKRVQLQRVRGWRKGNAVIVDRRTKWGNPFSVDMVGSRAEAVVRFCEYLALYPELVELARVELCGHDLACTCPLDGEPCHADVWLEVANE